ncbi:TolC family protein [Pseudomonas sp. 5P_3.1_Bac2]|uniref:TolC family protein n=1 Tax=Pseudomonas sp. 5P_3.1_Bac2 TaxID=2971617 RepID=UPI0021C73ECC|nr:TolC family protein [Pseudomonas sp. 5P_3.1_Bac2]MCU1719165.1 TolC family protein [Pseudomonas sp. 5P_3.1_Bac2]
MAIVRWLYLLSLLSTQALAVDVFATANGHAGQAAYDSDGSALPCHFGAVSQPLLLAEAIERSLCYDPQTRLAWASAKAQAAMAGVNQAAYLPRLDGQLGSSTGQRAVDYDEAQYDSSEGRLRRDNANLQLSWVLFDFGQREAALSQARQLLLAANANQDRVLQEAFLRAASAYYQALAAQRSVQASTQIAEMAGQNLEAADAKYKAGAAALSDRLQAQTAFSQASLQQVRDQGALTAALGVLALRMGLAAQTPLQLGSELSQVGGREFVQAVDKLLAQARQQHPALLAAQARVKAAEAGVEQVRAAGMPTIALTGELGWQRNRQGQELAGDYQSRERSIGLQVSLPLFEGFSRNYQIRNAQALLEASQAEVAQTEEEVALQLWANYQQLSVETQSLERTQQLVEQSQQALEVVQGRYRSGVGSMIEMLNGLTAYTAAQQQHIQSLSSWQTSRLGLAASLGRLGFWTLD